MDETADAARRSSQDLARETGESLGVPVLFGSASSSWGVRRLLKALRHEAPGSQSGRGPPRRQRSGACTCSRYMHGSIGRLALSRALGGHDPRRLGPQDRRRRARARRLAVQGPGRKDAEDQRSARRRRRRGRQDRHGQGRPMARRGQAPAAGRDRVSGAQLRDRDRTRGPQGRRQAVRRSPAADRGRWRRSSSNMTKPTTRSACAGSTTSISTPSSRG